MPKSESISVAVGAALFGIGGAGLLTLLIFRATPDAAWDKPWWWTAVCFSVAAMLAGAWWLASVYTPLPIPATRNERAKREAVIELAVKLYEANKVRDELMASGIDAATAETLVDAWHESVMRSMGKAPAYLPDFTSTESVLLKQYRRSDGLAVPADVSQHIARLDSGIAKVRRILEGVRRD